MAEPSECADLSYIVDHEALIATARLIHTLIFQGQSTPITKRICAWATATPRFGDLIVEVSSLGRDSADRVGLLESWAGEDHVEILVQVNPRRTCTWSNASFIRLPKNVDQWREALHYGETQ